MQSLLLAGSISFVTALIMTRICRDWFLRLGLLDRPDSERKLHGKPVPRVGGIAVALAYVSPFLIFSLPPLASTLPPLLSVPLPWALPLAAGIIFVTGLLDDLMGLKPWQKLAGQFIAALLACTLGDTRIHRIFGVSIGSWLSAPLTLAWLVGCTNAFNLIDGLDGLAAGVGILGTATIVLSALLQHNFALAAATVPLAASLAGFLRYNLNPASIFLGDSGSLLTGFLLGTYAVLWSEKSTAVLGMAAPLMALAFPLVDTGIAVIRRLLRGQPIFIGDRGHIHHRLLDRGLTPRRTVLLLYAFCGFGAVLSLVQSLQVRGGGLVVFVFCVLVWACIQQLHFVEFGAFGRLLTARSWRGTVVTNIYLWEFGEALTTASTADQCWQIVRRYYRRFGFNQVVLRLAGTTYTDAEESADPANSLTILVPISLYEYAQLSRASKTQYPPAALGAFAVALGAGLKAKSAILPGSDRRMNRRPELAALPKPAKRSRPQGAPGRSLKVLPRNAMEAMNHNERRN